MFTVAVGVTPVFNELYEHKNARTKKSRKTRSGALVNVCFTVNTFRSSGYNRAVYEK